jgi:hypothetical protein
MIGTFAKTAAILVLGAILLGCGQNQEKAAEGASSAPTTAAAPAPAAIAHGDALCDLIAAHFGALMPADAPRQLYRSGDMCKLGGPSNGPAGKAQVRVIVASRGGMTPALLASFRVAGHTIADAPDLGDGAFLDTLSPSTRAAKLNAVAEKNGHLITIEIEFARPITDADIQSAHAMSRDFIAAL